MKCWKPVAKWWLAVVTATLIVSGCGGGGNGIGDDRRAVSGALTTSDFDENRYYDVYDFTAEATGGATVEMRSDDFDADLIVYRQVSPDTFTEIATDDDGGTGTDAKVDFQITAATTYRVIATAHRRDTGDYTLIFTRNLGQPRLLLPNTAAASTIQAMVLPRAGQPKQGNE